VIATRMCVLVASTASEARVLVIHDADNAWS
jgi:hypothetical protein